MKTKIKIRQLGARFQIEHPHVEHVASLAMSLFDGFFPLKGLVKEDRKLLYAAACLHDIGYASDPERHVEAGVDILLRNPLPVFSSAEWKLIATVVLLHKRRWKLLLEHELFRELDETQQDKSKKLAAVLRIADGLDHGHIQDAVIRKCAHGKQTDNAEVLCRSYAGNVPWAAGKADLWEEAFGRPLQLKGKMDSRSSTFKGVVHERDWALSAARRILYSQYDVMRDNVPAMLEGGDPEHLHDYRVAMRRFRAALRMFRPLLADLDVQPLEKQLGEISDLLGPVRDLHVLFQFFESLDPAERGTGICFQSLEANVDEANLKLAGILESALCRAAVKDMNLLLRVQMPALEQGGAHVKFKSYAKQYFSRLMKRVRKIDISSIRENTEHMHAVRKQCRRWRYCAEFATPVLGKEVQTMAKHLQTVANALGDVRDAQTRIARFQDLPDAARVLQKLEQMRTTSWKRFSRSWAGLTGTTGSVF